MDGTDRTYDVIISEIAAGSLISHARFSALVSEDAAARLVAEFAEKAGSLERRPERNPWLDDPLIPPKKYRKLLMAKRYMLLYQVKGAQVHIETIVDCRQDYTWLL